MRDKKVSIFLQLLVFMTLYFLFDDIKSNFRNEINYILTRLFFLNTLLCILYYIKKQENDILFDSEDLFFASESSCNFFHLFWFLNVMLNLGIIINNFSKKFFIRANSYEDWVYILSMFLSTYIHYSMHTRISLFTQYNSQSSIACILHFLHYSNSFISFLSYLVINQLSPGDDNYRLLQKLLFYLIFCKFFIILRMPLAGDIGKICYSVVLLFEIKVKLQQISQQRRDDNKVSPKGQQDNKLSLEYPTQTQFLYALALITFSILCYSLYRVYQTWKYVEINGLYNDRSLFIDDQRSSVLINQNAQVRQRVKSTDGLNEVELQQLKRTQLEAIQIEPQQSQPSHTCSICFLEIEGKSTIYELECNHIFHTVCLDSWLKNKNSCPNCRSKVIQRSQLIISTLTDDSDHSIDNNNSLSDTNQQQQQLQQQQQQLLQQFNHFEEIMRQQNLSDQEGQTNNQQQANTNYQGQTSLTTLDYDEESAPHTADNLHSQQVLRYDIA